MVVLLGILPVGNASFLPMQDIQGGRGILLASVSGDIVGGRGVLIARDSGSDIEGGRGVFISKLSSRKQSFQRVLVAMVRKRATPVVRPKPTVADMIEAALARADKARDANPPRTDEAKASYQKAAELGDWRGYFELGNMALTAQDYASAVKYYELANKLKSDVPEVNFLLGSALFYGLNKSEEAYAPLKKAIELKPDADAYYTLGLVSYSLAKYAEAATAFEKAYALKPEASTQFNLATAYYQLGRYQDSAASYTKAIELGLDDEDKATATYNLGQAYYNLSRFEEAAAAFKQSAQLKPEDAQRYLDLGLAYYKAGHQAEAAEAFKRAATLKPDSAPAHNNLGYMLYLKGDYGEAAKEYKKSVEIDPRNAQVNYNLGNAYYRQKMYAEALASFKKAAELNPKLSKAFYMAGASYYTLGEYQEAAQAFGSATALEPEFAEAYYGLGNSDLMAGQAGEAAAAYEKAVGLKLDTDLVAKIYYLLGFTYTRLGKYQEAVRAFENPALRMSQYRAGNTHIIFNESVAYYRARRYKEAIETANLVLKQGIEKEFSPSLYVILGVSLAELKQYKEAATALEQATSLEPKNNDAQIRLMQTYDMLVRLGMEKDYYTKRAREHLKELEKVNPALAEQIRTGKIVNRSTPSSP
jgi:tetratricopeptide (TPR) repeat protein